MNFMRLVALYIVKHGHHKLAFSLWLGQETGKRRETREWELSKLITYPLNDILYHGKKSFVELGRLISCNAGKEVVLFYFIGPKIRMFL